MPRFQGLGTTGSYYYWYDYYLTDSGLSFEGTLRNNNVSSQMGPLWGQLLGRWWLHDLEAPVSPVSLCHLFPVSCLPGPQCLPHLDKSASWEGTQHQVKRYYRVAHLIFPIHT